MEYQIASRRVPIVYVVSLVQELLLESVTVPSSVVQLTATINRFAPVVSISGVAPAPAEVRMVLATRAKADGVLNSSLVEYSQTSCEIDATLMLLAF